MRETNRKADPSVTKIRIIVFAIIIIAAVLSVCIARLEKQADRGFDSVKGEGNYQLYGRLWTGTDEHSMPLRAGERIHIEWSLQAGAIDISVAMPEHAAIYKADGVSFKTNPDASFDVVIPESGDYVIRISTKEATGTVGVMKALQKSIS